MAMIANTVGADAWVNIPALATDDYVTKAAQLLSTALDSNRKVYIEYSNEVWNYGFIQESYAQRMGNLAGGKSGQWFTVKRSFDLFKIFETEFGGTSRLVKVIPSQAADSDLSDTMLAFVSDPTANPYNMTADALAIAPYFAGAVADAIVANNEVDTITVEEILDRCRDAVYAETGAWVQASSLVAKKYNVKLVSYESGQSLVGNGANQNIVNLTAKLEAANRDPRMRAIYLAMYYEWQANGGDLLNYFTHIQIYSKYGSWGITEYQTDTPANSPKYAAFLEVLKAYSTGHVATQTETQEQKVSGAVELSLGIFAALVASLLL